MVRPHPRGRNPVAVLKGWAGRVTLAAMIWKLLLTAAVILGAFLVIRARMRRAREAQGLVQPRPPLVPPGTVRITAYGLAILMVAGSAFLLLRDWGSSRDLVTVTVVNANTGGTASYRARRGDIGDRRFQTLDGREVRLADVERMILEPAP